MQVPFSFPDYLLIFIAIFNFAMALFIFFNNPKNKINISFTFFSSFLTLWAILLLFFRHVPIEYAAFFMRAIYGSGIGIAITLWYFIHFFPTRNKFLVFNKFTISIITALCIGLLLYPGFIVHNAFTLADGSRTVTLNPYGYYLFTAVFFLLYVGGLILFFYRIRSADKIVKKQSRVLMIGMTIAVIFGGYFNILLPGPQFLNYHHIHWGPFFTLFIVLSVAYGVAKLQLMNIKALFTELFVIGLMLVLIIESIFLRDPALLLLRGLVIVGVIIFGYLLIRQVVKEVKQREEVARLASSLEKANDRLKELDRQKTEFLSIASHQLRTPLSIIKGYIELIEDGAYGKVTKKTLNVLRDMDDSNERLVNLVDEFLNISRIEQGRTKFSFSESSINTMIDGVFKELYDRAKGKGLELLWPRDDKMQDAILMDEEKIRHVAFNFVDNAIKYSDSGTITLTAKKEDGGIAVRVNDEGLGFSKEDEANFFQKFYRGKNVEGINVNGTGLGIYVCKKFIDAHDGRVWAHSDGLGKGGEFGFWIPEKKSPPKKTKQ